MFNACERHVRDALRDLRDGVLFESTRPKQLLDDPLTDPDHHTLEDHVECQNLEGLLVANVGSDASDDGLHVVREDQHEGVAESSQQQMMSLV